jgi:hypothetical protein
VQCSPAFARPNDDDACVANPTSDNQSIPKKSYCARQNCHWIYQNLANDCVVWYVSLVHHDACDAYYYGDDGGDGVASQMETEKEEKSEDRRQPYKSVFCSHYRERELAMSESNLYSPGD